MKPFFYYDDVKLSIGVTADFMQQEGQIVTNGIELTTTSPITFVVSWIQPVTEDNDLQTFFSVDLFYFVNNKKAMDTHKRTVSIAFFNI